MDIQGYASIFCPVDFCAKSRLFRWNLFLILQEWFEIPRKTVAAVHGGLYDAVMKPVEIEQEALALPDGDRASLVAKLLDTLPPPGTDVSDEEVERCEREMDLGQVAAISHEEFVRRVQEQRGR